MLASIVVGTFPKVGGRIIPAALIPAEKLCPCLTKVEISEPFRRVATEPLNMLMFKFVPPLLAITPIWPDVPRIPAVPTGDSILKLDLLSNFLTSKTISPSSKSITVWEELGSPFISDNFFLPGSNFSCVNFLILRAESDFIVDTVPLERRRIIFDAGPVLTV